MNEDLRRGDGISFRFDGPAMFAASEPESSKALKRKAKDARKAYEAAKAREKDRKRTRKAEAKAAAEKQARDARDAEVARATLHAVAQNSKDDAARVSAAFHLNEGR